MQKPEMNKKTVSPDDAGHELLRLFYALIPDEQTKDDLQRWQSHVTGKKTPRENLHMTLFFLGNQRRNHLAAFKRFIDRIAFVPFEIRLDTMGYFPKIGLSWIGPQQLPFPLERLYQDTHEFLVPAYLKGKKEKYRPHITLARRSLQPGVKMDSPVIWRVNRLVLMQSVLSNEPGRHAEYRILHEKA